MAVSHVMSTKATGTYCGIFVGASGSSDPYIKTDCVTDGNTTKILALYIPDVASHATKDITLRVKPDPDAMLELSPMDLNVEMPMLVGCFRQYNLSFGALPVADLTGALIKQLNYRLFCYVAVLLHFP